LIVKQFKLNNTKEKLSILRYPVNIYRDSEMKNWVSSFVNAGVTNAVTSGVKGESLPDISKFSGKANVSQGVVRFAAGENFNAYGIKASNTQVLDMAAVYKSEKGALPSKGSPSKSQKPKVKGGSKAIKKRSSPMKAGGVADKLARFTPGGKKVLAKKSVAGPAGGPMASPGDKMSEGATAEVKTMKQFKKMVEYLKKNKNKGKKSVGVKGGKASRK